MRGGGVGDFEKKIPESACCLWWKKGEKYPAHQIARKKILDDQKSPPPPLRVKWSAPNTKLIKPIVFNLFYSAIDAVTQFV